MSTVSRLRSLNSHPCLSWSVTVCLYLFATPAVASKPAPLSIPVDASTWLGYDGNWNPLTIQVGTPAQWVYLLPNILSSETWVIGPGGCDGTFTCEQERGGLFNQSASSSWQGLGLYELDFDTDLGVTGGAGYGYDEIAFNSGQVAAAGQVVGILNTTQFWLGDLGLGVEQIDFTATATPTFLSSLVQNESVIPSHSFGYTAGAYYRLKNVPASLTFGGVDTNRFVPTDTTFALNSNLQPVVSINEITVTADPGSGAASQPNWTSPQPLSTASDAALFTIDSSTPFLWLPEAVCDRFASAFGLFYNETLQLYTFEGNSTDQSQLSDWNLTFTFTIANLPGSANSTKLTLPYEAFDLELNYPFPNYWANYTSPSLKYFPVRKAANSSQYTIGRMFLQETYLTVDYERNNFSLSQAKFASDALTNINLVEITRPANSPFAGPQTSSTGLSTAAKIGIGVGVGAGAALLLSLAIVLILRRRRRGSQKQGGSAAEKTASLKRPFLRLWSSHGSPASEAAHASSDVLELPASKRQPAEIAADQSNTRFELIGSVPIEMEGSIVPSSYYTNEAHRSARPAELGHNRRSSTFKAPDAQGQYRDEPENLPLYSPTSQSGDSISPNSLTRSNCGAYTTSSGEHVVSPTTATGPRSVAGSGSAFPSPNTPGISDGSGSGSLPSTLAAIVRSSTAHSNNDHLGAATSSSDPGVTRSASSRSSRFKEEGLGLGPLRNAGSHLGSDSGYRIREPGPESRKFERLTRLLDPASKGDNNDPEQRRFSWEEE